MTGREALNQRASVTIGPSPCCSIERRYNNQLFTTISYRQTRRELRSFAGLRNKFFFAGRRW